MNFKSEPWQINDKESLASKLPFLTGLDHVVSFVLASKTQLQSCARRFASQITSHTCGKQVKMILVYEFKCILTCMTFIGRRLEFFQTSHQQNVKETSSNRHMVVRICRTTFHACTVLLLVTVTCVPVHRYQTYNTAWSKTKIAWLCNLPHWFHKQHWQLGWDSGNPHQNGQTPCFGWPKLS